MQSSDEGACLSTAEVTATDDTYTIDRPQREIEQGTITRADSIGVYSSPLVQQTRQRTTGPI
jgi:hypothetical protein